MAVATVHGGERGCEVEPRPPTSQPHDPVLLQRCTELLAIPPSLVTGGAVLVDATVGAGGHAAALLAASAEGVHLVGFDRDPQALELADRRLAAYRDRVHLVHAGYEHLEVHVAPVAAAAGPVLGVLYDLGVSSMQLDRPGRGFSFRADAPLDMRMDPTSGPTAGDLVNSAEPAELVRILRTYGEERAAGRIVRALVAARPVTTTAQLAAIVSAAVPAAVRRASTHPATKTFQALRIAVNGELDRFSASLPQALQLLAPPDPGPGTSPGPSPSPGPGTSPGPDPGPARRPGQQAWAGGGRRGGRVAVISYHSLEDRTAKRILSEAATGCVCPPDLPVCGCGRVPLVASLTRGAEAPAASEVERNPRARSARLRAAEKLVAAKVS